MSMILATLLAGQTPLPQIDRRSLELQARAEALHVTARRAARSAVQANWRSSPLDLNSITTICRAAGGQTDPAGFLSRLSTAYSLDREGSEALRSNCASYLSGQAQAHSRSSNTY